MQLPNFILAGFPKCGSTSLYYYLIEHPEIYIPKHQKELHFFTYEHLNERNKGKGDSEITQFHVGTFEEYKQCFAAINGEKAIGDVSPSYANYEDCIPRIKDTLGEDTKVIFIMRDPVQRAYSNYLHLVREGRETKSFMEALNSEEERIANRYSDFWYYIFNSDYYPKIENMRTHLNSILLITFEAFIADPEKGIREIYEFLGVDPEFTPSNLNTSFNAGGVYRQNVLTRFIFSQNKLKSWIKKVLPIGVGMKKAKLKVISRFKMDTPEMPEDAKKFLQERFKDDIPKLRAMGVRTEYWKYFEDSVSE